jgi:hypothetical protein
VGVGAVVWLLPLISESHRGGHVDTPGAQYVGLDVLLLESVAVIGLFFGAVAVAFGIGILYRMRWARIVVFVISPIFSLAGVVFAFLAFVWPPDDPLRLPAFLAAAVLIGYCVWSYVALLNWGRPHDDSMTTIQSDEVALLPGSLVRSRFGMRAASWRAAPRSAPPGKRPRACRGSIKATSGAVTQPGLARSSRSQG